MALLKPQSFCRDERFLSYLAVCIGFLIFLQFWAFEKKWYFSYSKASEPFAEIFSESDAIFSPNASAAEVSVASQLRDMRSRIRASLLCASSNHSLEAMVEEVSCLKEVLFLGSPNSADVDSAISVLESLRRETVSLKERIAVLTKGLSEGRAVAESDRRAVEERDESDRLEVAEKHRRVVADMRSKLVASTEFRRLKDSRESGLTETGHNWFMSSVDGQAKNGLPESFDFPADDPYKRLLCLKGNHSYDGTLNFYGFAWKEFLPPNAVFMPGLTLVADNYWDYHNPWHSMSALVYFISWRSRNSCAVPKRVVLYHWGELLTDMGPWIESIMHSALGASLRTDATAPYSDRPVCFERAVVNRRGLGGMSLENLNTLIDIVRCRARKFCKVEAPSLTGEGISVTLLTRSGARAFTNESGVASVIDEQCRKFAGCRLQVVPVSNLSFCEQVQVMSSTDVFITSHGAQLTNMLFMSPGGAVMEMLPKGWLEFAGIGQYIYKWLADWSRLHHEGVWRDPQGPDCPYPPSEELRCFLFHKDATVGLNATYLASWVTRVLEKQQERRGRQELPISQSPVCACDALDATHVASG